MLRPIKALFDKRDGDDVDDSFDEEDFYGNGDPDEDYERWRDEQE